MAKTFDGALCVKCGGTLRYVKGRGCVGCTRTRMRRLREVNPAAYNERARRWREANPTAVRETRRRHYDADPVAHREASRRWKAANPTASHDAVVRWREENPDVARVHARRSAAKARGIPVPPWQTTEERAAIDAFVASCPLDMTIDHIAPLGHPEVIGLHVLVNLQYLTMSENSRKGSRLPDGLTPAQAVERGMAIWRCDVDPDGTVDWEGYRPA